MRAEFGKDLPYRRIGECREPEREFWHPVQGNALSRSTHARLQHPCNFQKRHEVAAHGQEVLAFRGGIGHRAQVKVRHIAHVDDTEMKRGCDPGEMFGAGDEQRTIRLRNVTGF